MREYETNDFYVQVLNTRYDFPANDSGRSRKQCIWLNLAEGWVTPAKLRQISKRFLRIAERAEMENPIRKARKGGLTIDFSHTK